MKPQYSVLLFTALFLLACNSISLNSKFQQLGFDEDVKKLATNNLITGREKNVLELYLTVHRNDSSIRSSSYKELLVAAKYDDSVRKKKFALQAELNSSIKIKVIGKYLHVENTEEGQTRTLVVDITAKNETTNQIAGLIVHINFRNSKGVIFYDAEWPLTASISPNTTTTIRLSAGEYDNSNQRQMQLAMADLKKITVDYEISKLMYDDGTAKSINNN